MTGLDEQGQGHWKETPRTADAVVAQEHYLNDSRDA